MRKFVTGVLISGIFIAAGSIGYTQLPVSISVKSGQNTITYCNPITIPDIPFGKWTAQQNRQKVNYWSVIGENNAKGDQPYSDSGNDRWLETDGQDCRELADPTMLFFKGKWYLFPSSLPGPLWFSDDLVNWKYHDLGLTIAYAPTVVIKGEWLYLTSSGSKMMWRAKHPFGPWEELGPSKDMSGNYKSWFDPCLFVDDDGKMYIYYGSSVALLRDDDPTRFAEEPKTVISLDLQKNTWGRAGTHNQDINRSYTEAPWMTKYNGRYYLQFSVGGTEYKSYAVGCLVGDTPYGPFRLQKRNPILVQKGGMINGTAHHSVFPGPSGKLWAVYTTLIRNTHLYERRLGIDPVGFDENGEMFISGPSETPQFAPGIKSDPEFGNDVRWDNLSADPVRVRASSSAPGRDPAYGCDDNLRTWWEAAGTSNEWLEIDLNSICDIRSFRTIFADRGLNRKEGIVPGPYCYRIEGTKDGKDWVTLVDQSKNGVDRQITYETCQTSRVRYIKITILSAPKGMRIALWDFTVFGNVVPRSMLLK
jgi:xylan 1,4-beta-xylosidase